VEFTSDPLRRDSGDVSTDPIIRTRGSRLNIDEFEEENFQQLPAIEHLRESFVNDDEALREYEQFITVLEASPIPNLAADFASCFLPKPGQPTKSDLFWALRGGKNVAIRMQRQFYSNIQGAIQPTISSTLQHNASRQATPQPRDITPQEIAARRKNCFERMPKLKKGADIELHFIQVRRALHMDGAGLSDARESTL
jgi:hypothetical protein